jgi:hypothetical protein
VCGKGFNIPLAKTKGGGKKEVIDNKKRSPHRGTSAERIIFI